MQVLNGNTLSIQEAEQMAADVRSSAAVACGVMCCPQANYASLLTLQLCRQRARRREAFANAHGCKNNLAMQLQAGVRFERRMHYQGQLWGFTDSDVPSSMSLRS